MKAETRQWMDHYEMMDRQLSQQEANYNPLGMTDAKGCANCRWFVEPNCCIIVQGPINPTGVSDYWMADVPSDMESMSEDTAEPGEEDSMGMGMSEVTVQAGEKAVWSTAFMNDLPDSSFLYIEPGGSKDSEGKTTPRSLRHFPVKGADGKPAEAQVRNALARIPQSGVSSAAKAAALARARSMAKSLGIKVEAGSKSLSENIKDMFGNFVQAVRGDDVDTFGLKEVDGRTRFMCTFTNCAKDKEQTIFSTAAHKDFEQWVDRTGRYPELWIWHTPGTRMGVTDWIAESNGVQYASGLIDEGQELRAYELAGSKDLAMSHGYVYAEQRDGVYEKYRSYEISVLPRKYAANGMTAFELLGEKAMAFTEQKRNLLMQQAGYSAEEVAALEEGSTKFVEFAKTLGVEMKDTEEVETTAQTSIMRDLNDIKQVLVKMSEGIQAVDAKATEAGEKALAATQAAAKSVDDIVADHMTSQIARLPIGQKATESENNVVDQKQAEQDLSWFDGVFEEMSKITGGIR